jgi:uncharacterized protein (TIGR03067 family)
MYQVLLVSLVVLAGSPTPKKASEEESIVAEWTAVKAANNGVVHDVPEKGYSLTFTADGKMIEQRGAEGSRGEGTYKLNPKPMPAEIDLVSAPDKKKPTVLAIYKLDGDTLTICLSNKPEAPRPKAFEAPEGSGLVVLTLKRVLPKK